MARETYRRAVEELLHSEARISFATAKYSASYCAARLLGAVEFGPAIIAIYRALGGLGAPAPRPGEWDVATREFILEFDEQQHFNRYRLTTLSCPLYSQLRAFPLSLYRSYSTDFEPECAAKACGGKYWTSSSSERQFGRSDPPGHFEKHGSARWKQRAFYDMMKDLAPLAGAVPVARIALWDQLGESGVTVRTALDRRCPLFDREIADLALSRAAI